MNILIWNIHGGWMESFLRGNHHYLIPHDEQHPLPSHFPGAHSVSSTNLKGVEVDIVILQRVEEITLVEILTGKQVGKELPAIFVEHNTPKEHPIGQVHPLADRTDIPVVHVTHFNRLMWDNGQAPTTVIEHGVCDLGYKYTGQLPHLGVVINEPVRRNRVTGTDLLPQFAEAAPVDCFGIDTDLLPAHLGLRDENLHPMGDYPTPQLHAELPLRRAYLHTTRWTSLGLSLLESMMLGMPVLALATTEAIRAVPPEAGAISVNPRELVNAARDLIASPDEARRRGLIARDFALQHYGLERFHHDWDELLMVTVDNFLTMFQQRKEDRHENSNGFGTREPASQPGKG